MRTKEQLESKEFEDDMSDLEEELKKHKFSYTFKRHKGADPSLIDLIGYYPTGEWHINIGDVSVIRGMCSFGDYEAYGGKYKEPERFATAKELVADLLTSI